MRLCDGYCIKGFLLHSDLTVYPLVFAEQADIAREFGKIYAAPKLTRNWLQSGCCFGIRIDPHEQQVKLE
ncbi:hypothetical protein JG688_00003861 [Phytophthora aleatoria]|uniref:Uncharacterized protein n=1 Tax=Phytophthora aleatoria TaxID=2496075 RepID=A0A8J5MI91_9STRA|nr:hypothetical protein JG688_00003861 [Phytophthora aleatoria]